MKYMRVRNHRSQTATYGAGKKPENFPAFNGATVEPVTLPNG